MSISIVPSPSIASELSLFDQFHLFGDSLSDPGNVFNVSSAANAIANSLPPGTVPPGTVPPVSPVVPPYDKQGRITNDGDADDAIWVDTVATAFGFEMVSSTAIAIYSPLNPAIHPNPPYLPFFPPNQPTPVLPLLLPSGPNLEVNTFLNGATQTQNINFAYGGATSGLTNVSDERVPGVLAQIDSFVADLNFAGATANANALYGIWGGSNDFDPIATGISVDPLGPVDNAETAIQQLYDAGARQFLVVNMPDLGTRPLLDGISNSAAIQAEYTTVTHEYNELLESRLAQMQTDLDGATVIPVEEASFFSFVRANAEAFGFTNIDDSFLFSADPSTASVDEYIFWDGEHPTRAAHAILGEFVTATIVANASDEALRLRGTQELEILIGGGLDDRINARQGNDLVIGGFGNDRLLGRQGRDLLNGGPGLDYLKGGAGRDDLYGGIDADILGGGKHNDRLMGGLGADALLGGAGDDWLDGGRGSDSLFGGPGADTYVFGRSLLDGIADTDVIVDFQPNDQLDVSAFRSAGGTVETQRLLPRLLRVSLGDTNGGGDRIFIQGNAEALSELTNTLAIV
ncbi:MAG: SGNH/GDSL hydrolase family protein [Cyanobacteria bacterium P01_F01_bin.150]